jgi:hypothetical protein
MDQQTNQQEPSSTEGGEMKNPRVGDWVWVKGQIKKTQFGATETEVEICEQRVYVRIFDCRPVEPSPKEPTPGQKLAERTMKAIWAANDSVNGTPAIKEPLATKPNSSEIPNSSIRPLAVGDAVRFVLPRHERHGTEGIILSIVRGPNRQYRFESNCGQFHRYCTIAELEHYNQADPIDIKGSMQSLDGADTIQAGDLQWTDRDGKYRLCNFTIGMRVYQAIERGKAHGEKWVFYRKFKEVGE